MICDGGKVRTTISHFRHTTLQIVLPTMCTVFARTLAGPNQTSTQALPTTEEVDVDVSRTKNQRRIWLCDYVNVPGIFSKITLQKIVLSNTTHYFVRADVG